MHSPTLSGSSTLTALRPLRLPTVLVGSHLLGGISATLSAYDSLLMHGYDVDGVVVLKEDRYANWEYLRDWGRDKGLWVGAVELPPERLSGKEEERKSMEAYYDRIAGASTEPNGGSSAPTIASLVKQLQRRHATRLEALDTLPRRTLDQVWWPFVQHTQVQSEGDVTVIDSAHGDFFAAHRPLSSNPAATATATAPLLSPTFDGSASWWTQTLGHANPVVTAAAASAAGRYGHVLFPNCSHEPAVDLTERLLQGPGRGWASRVFFSDDGSTAVEVALKMALASYARRYGLGLNLGEGASEPVRSKGQKPFGVIGIKGSYHGDTIGAMDASEESVYNAQVQWYEGKGFWLDPPTVQLEAPEDGPVVPVIAFEGAQLAVTRQAAQELPGSVPGGRRPYPGGLAEVYDVGKRVRTDPLADVYRRHLREILDVAVRKSPYQLASLILEPVVMGAGGMVFVDPLFQRVLIDLVRTEPGRFSPSDATGTSASSYVGVGAEWTGLPIIFDEVFSGLRRLGRPSAASFLGDAVHPDIAVYAKILTAGTVPMSVTLATDAIFNTFQGDTKVEALLHGHSYTAHPIGCAIANAGLSTLDRMDQSGAWTAAQDDWQPANNGPKSTPPAVWSLWKRDVVERIAASKSVSGVMAMGTLLAVYLKPQEGGGGYTSGEAAALIQQLQQRGALASSSPAASGGRPFHIHARPLGNVAYLMTSLTTKRETLHDVEAALLQCLL